jgi:hypothetical protein
VRFPAVCGLGVEAAEGATEEVLLASRFADCERLCGKLAFVIEIVGTALEFEICGSWDRD